MGCPLGRTRHRTRHPTRSRKFGNKPPRYSGQRGADVVLAGRFYFGRQRAIKTTSYNRIIVLKDSENRGGISGLRYEFILKWSRVKLGMHELVGGGGRKAQWLQQGAVRACSQCWELQYQASLATWYLDTLDLRLSSRKHLPITTNTGASRFLRLGPTHVHWSCQPEN